VRLGFLDGIAGLRSHRDRLLRELHEIRKAARAFGGRMPAASAAPRRGERRRVRVLVTGCAGFIGMHTAERLLDAACRCSASTTSTLLRRRAEGGARGAACRPSRIPLERIDLADAEAPIGCSAITLHARRASRGAAGRALLAHQSPAYFRNNLTAFGHVIEGCRRAGVAHLVYASSSSVYGANHASPFSEEQNVDHPVSSTRRPRSRTS
jgi:UDP-glucuronate 4-epimerase